MIEVLVAMMLLSVVGGALTTGIVTGFRAHARQTEYQQTLNEVKLAFERTTRELRATDEIQQSSLSPHTINLRICRGGVPKWLYFRLNTTTTPASFTVQNPTGTTPRTLASGLLAPTVATFTYLDGSGAELIFPAAPGDFDTTAAKIRSIIFHLEADVGGAPVVLENHITVRNSGGVQCA